MAKAILINPFEKKVRIVAIDGDKGLSPFYSAIGCKLVDIIPMDNGKDIIVIDEEGIFNQRVAADKPTPAWYCLPWYSQPLAGTTIIIGEKKGNSYQDISEETIKQLYSFAQNGSLKWAEIDPDSETWRTL